MKPKGLKNWAYIPTPWKGAWGKGCWLAVHGNPPYKWGYTPISIKKDGTPGHGVFVYGLDKQISPYQFTNEGMARAFILKLEDGLPENRAYDVVRHLKAVSTLRFFKRDTSVYTKWVPIYRVKGASEPRMGGKCLVCHAMVPDAPTNYPPGTQTAACGFAINGFKCMKCNRIFKHGEPLGRPYQAHLICPSKKKAHKLSKKKTKGAPKQLSLRFHTRRGYPIDLLRRIRRAAKFEWAATIAIDAYDLWGLPSLTLPTEAADFYVLEYLVSVRGHTEARPILREKTAELSMAFSAYLNMACGGEVRHWDRYANFSAGAHALEKISLYYPGTTGLREKKPAREEAWIRWYYIWKQHGMDALHSAYNIFDGMKDEYGDAQIHWPGGFGGKAWALIAKTLIRHLTGKLSSKLFVDTVWALQHNGGTVLDKAPGRFSGCGSLNIILNAQRAGKIKTLVHASHDSIQELYAKLEETR